MLSRGSGVGKWSGVKLERRAEIQVPEPRYRRDDVEKKVEAIIEERLATRRPNTDSKGVRLQLLQSFAPEERMS